MPQYNIKDKKYIERNNDVFDVVLIADKLGNLQVNSDLFNNIAIANGSVDGVKYFNKIGAVPECRKMYQEQFGILMEHFILGIL